MIKESCNLIGQDYFDNKLRFLCIKLHFILLKMSFSNLFLISLHPSEDPRHFWEVSRISGCRWARLVTLKKKVFVSDLSFPWNISK